MLLLIVKFFFCNMYYYLALNHALLLLNVHHRHKILLSMNRLCLLTIDRSIGSENRSDLPDNILRHGMEGENIGICTELQ